MTTTWPIICPIRNNLELTQDAVETFLAQDVPTTLHLINNGSEPATRAWLFELEEAHPERVFVEHNYPPRCVAASWNQALVRLFAKGEPWVLVCNNDVQLHPATYRLLAQSARPFVTGVGVSSEAQFRAGPDLTAAVRPHPDFSCFLIRREVYLRVGLFDETFQPAFREDQDYHWRMKCAGVEAVSIGLPFLHVGAGSQTVKQDVVARAENDKHTEVNRAYYAGKWGGEWPDEHYVIPFGWS